MKTKFTLLIAMTIAFFSAKSQVGQVTNDTFTYWNTFAPVGWTTYESIFGTALGLATEDTTLADLAFGQGSAAVKLVSNSIALDPAQGVIAGVVSLGTGGQSAGNPYFVGTPFPYRPDTLFAVYKYNTPGIDTPTLFLLITKPDTIALAINAYLPTGTGTFTLGEFPFTSYYSIADAGDTLLMQFKPSNVAPVKGSTLIMNLVLFGYQVLPTGLQQIADKMEFALYPNPSTNMVNISTAENAAGFKILISDMAGKYVYGGGLNGNKTSVSTESLASGMYVYRIADSSGNILKQDKFVVTH